MTMEAWRVDSDLTWKSEHDVYIFWKETLG